MLVLNDVLDRFYLSLVKMSRLLTRNPIALRFLMSETIFSSAIEKVQPENIPIDNELIKTDSSLSDNNQADLLFRGSNERNILFLVQNQEQEYFSFEAEDAFLKTLAALKLSLKDVAVINQRIVEKSVDEVKKVMKPKVCIVCEGENTANQSIFNQIIEVDGIACLHTYSFEEMLTDTNKKRSFWNAIKRIITG